MKKTSPEISDFKKLDWSVGVVIAFASLLFACISGFTAYQYNEIDMLPFWERMANPDFLPNDFFTNASVSPNSRQVWGYLVVFISKLTGAHWYTVVYGFKLIFISSVGSLYFLVLSKFHKHFIGNDSIIFKLIIGIFCTLCVCNNYFVQFFTIAWWPPYIPDANAHNISIFFGLVSILFVGKFSGIILCGGAALIHPVMGLMFFAGQAFFLLAEKKYIKLLLSAVIAILLPFLFHSIVFQNEQNLSAKEFAEIYAWYRHPGHYIPSLFGKMGLSSLQVYVLNVFLLAGAAWYSHLKKNKKLFRLSFGILVFVHVLLGLQFFLVEKFPVKIIAILGPSRYLMFMGWGIAFLYAILLGDFVYRVKFWEPVCKVLSNSFFLYSIVGSSVLLLGWLILSIDSPQKEKDNEVLTWMRTQTPTGSTFVSNNWILDEMDIRYIAQRAVYIGECFPFQEDFFREYHKRSQSVYGNPEQWKGEKNIVLQRLYFFRKMSPSDFVDASERFPLDYVIIDARDSLKFMDFTPEFKNEHLRIYSISAFKGQGPNHLPFLTRKE
jgi:hypothetical protein